MSPDSTSDTVADAAGALDMLLADAALGPARRSVPGNAAFPPLEPAPGSYVFDR